MLPEHATSIRPGACVILLTPASIHVAGAGFFTVDSGQCTVASDATCFRSPNYPSRYNDHDICRITVTAHEQVTLSVVAFNTESGYDRLRVAGVWYEGTIGPDGIQVAAGASIIFTSDGSYTMSGFEVCGACIPHIASSHRGQLMP